MILEAMILPAEATQHKGVVVPSISDRDESRQVSWRKPGQLFVVPIMSQILLLKYTGFEL